MARRNSISAVDTRKLLVERVAASSYLNRSARLRDLFLYLCERVLEAGADNIHEHEVGHKVFDRPPDYDTSADNIVRVHASMLRKRIDQYFATEGRLEPVVIEIPKGNYAPIFHKRPAEPVQVPVPTIVPLRRTFDWEKWLPAALAAVFLFTTIFFWHRSRVISAETAAMPTNRPNVRQFWSEIFRAGQPADIVLDDASVGLFQEFTAHPIALTDYYERSYLRSLEGDAASAKLDPNLAMALVSKRQSSYAGAALLWKLAQTASALRGDAKIQFARNYSFREMKADNVILLGNSRSNPWIEPFQSHLAIRWQFDSGLGAYYPVDTAAPASERERFRSNIQPGEPRGTEPHEGYATISLLPNLGSTGRVLIISGTGSVTVGAALDFLSDESSLTQLRSRLPQNKSDDFPYFEALLRARSRSTLPRDTSIVVCRPPQP